MKLWMKIFIFVFLLFIAAFYAGIFSMSSFSYATSLKTARNQAFTEHDFIASSFSNDLDSILKRNTDNSSLSINSLMSYYSGHYKKQNVFLGLVYNYELITGNLPETEKLETLKNTADVRTSIIDSVGSQKYIYVSGQILDNYIFIYSRDITEIVHAQEQLTQILIASSIGIVLFFVIVLYFLIRILTKPIKVLQNVTKRITAGEYDVRAETKGNDEISVLAACFNEMSEKILSKANEQKKISLQKQQFIDNLAHELKTPLTAIYGYAELLQKTKISNEDLIDATSNIMLVVKRIQDMSEKLLELAITRDLTVDFEPIELKLLFKKIQDNLSLRLKEKNIMLNISCEDCFIFGDSVLIENLFVNLLDNAIKASYENNEILISSFKQDDTIVVEIKDNGIGISKKHLDYIFDPFYKTDFARSNTGTQHGAGLGLALCKQIAEAHKAKMEIESEPDHGTKIKIIFTTLQQLHKNSMIL